MLLAWSSVSPCNHSTEAVNLPMLTPRISGVGTASLAGTICFRVSQNCTELAQNWKRPQKELDKGYKPAESTVPWWMISQHFAAICTCPPSHWGHWAGHYLHAANQGNAAQNWLFQQLLSWAKRSGRGRVVVGSCVGQQPLCPATMNEIIWEEQPGRGWLGSRQTVQWAQGAQSLPSTCLSHLNFNFTQVNWSQATSPSRRNEGCR